MNCKISEAKQNCEMKAGNFKTKSQAAPDLFKDSLGFKIDL